MTPVAGLLPSFFPRVARFCNELQCDPFDALGVWMNESGVSPTACNPDGWASGVFQAMPDTLRGMGFKGDNGYVEPTAIYLAAKGRGDKPECARLNKALAASFRTLTADRQVDWATRYYLPHKGKLVNAAAIYTATFLPADIALAADLDAVLVDVHGRRAWAYKPNKGFDRNLDGKITVREEVEAIERACVGARWDAIRNNMREHMGLDPVPATPKPQPTPGSVAWIQWALNKLGNYGLVQDGIPGPATRFALKGWQKTAGLVADGIPGPNTRRALDLALHDVQT